MIGVLALACTAPDPRPRADGAPPTDGRSTADTAATGDTSSPAATGETGLPTRPECMDLPDGSSPVPVTPFTIPTTEDFDFDALGNLVYSDGISFKAVDAFLNYSTIAPGVPDTRGIQILENGDLVAAYPPLDMVGYTFRLTGASYPLLTEVNNPNALEVGDDQLFVTETGVGQVRAFDLDTLAATNVAQGFLYPNGLALDDEQDILYVSDTTVGIYKVTKSPDGFWGPKELVFDAPPTETFDAIEVDVCGNVYTVGFGDGQLFRFDPGTGERVMLVDLNSPRSFLYNSIRWGSGRGGWRRDVLYVTDRNRIFGVEVGVEGRRQPVDAMP